MIKTPIESSVRMTPASAQSPGTALRRKGKSSGPSGSGRFPPVENALSAIVKNKRFSEAKGKIRKSKPRVT